MKKTRRAVLASFATGTAAAGGIAFASGHYLENYDGLLASNTSEPTTTTTTVTGAIPAASETTTATTTTTTTTTTDPTTTTTAPMATTTTETTTTATTTTETTTTTSTTTTTTTTTKEPAKIEIESQATRINEDTDNEKLKITATATNVGGTTTRTTLRCLIYQSVGDSLSLGTKTNEFHDPGEDWTVTWTYGGGGLGDDDIDDYTDYEVNTVYQ